MHISTFDADGEQSGAVVIWSDGDSPIRLDANFADGLYLVVHVNGDGVGNVIGCMIAGFVISCNCLEIVNETPMSGLTGW